MTQAATRAEQRRALFRIVMAFLKIAVAIYVLLLAGLYLCQRQLEYIPVSFYPGTPKENNVPEMSIVTVRTSDNLSLIGWFAGPKHVGGKVVVLFHGQGIDFGENAFKARYFLNAGYGVFLSEYPGFAGNPGTPTEEGLYRGARAVMGWLKDQGYDAHVVVLYGESLGTGVAVQMATEFPVADLILEAPYASAVEIAAHRYPYFPIRQLMKDPLDSLSKIARVTSPMLIVHGALDADIPIEYGRKLFDAATAPKKFLVVQGAGHPPDLYNHGAGKMIVDWLDKQGKAK